MSSLPPVPATEPSGFSPVPEAPTKTSGLAIASLIVGLCGVVTCGLGSIVGLVLGIIALGSTTGDPPLRRGKGIAIAGIVISVLTASVGIAIGIGLLLVPAIEAARDSAMKSRSTFQLKGIAQAVQMYAAANNDRFPPPADWAGAISRYSSGVTAPNAALPWEMAASRTIAMNAALKGKRISDLHAPFKTVLLFEAPAGSSRSGGIDQLPSNPFSRDGYMIVFADGSVRLVPDYEVETLIWNP